MALTTPTKPQFPRFQPHLDSRSPSRSPRRKAQFAIRELDPLLGNLSPDSTLRALQATETIPGGAAQDALASSIGDATPAEREIGIRAAFAAQKLREWTTELSGWAWPGKRERASGLGFITPFGAKGTGVDFRGFLTVTLADQYESRLDDIRDDLDSLGIDEIKEHVLEAHVPAKASPESPQATRNRTSYGRMRDFTALVTATVIQALPDLAKLNGLLDTWDIRLRVLKELPRFLQVLESTQADIQAAFNEVRDSELSQNVTEDRFESKKAMLGSQVADVDRRIDRLLDMLEGQEDSLPQAWIDRLEKIELDYATWVVEAEHVVLRNKLAMTTNKSAESGDLAERTLSPVQEKLTPPDSETKYDISRARLVAEAGSSTANGESASPSKHGTPPRRKPSLKLNMSDQKGHRREISKVSVADSTYSAFSDISNAEIMDARTTSVLPSPKVSVIDNPFRTSRDELTWFGNPSIAQEQMKTKPPMLQRASTASFEVFPKEQVKRVMLTRSASWDMLSEIPQSPESTPSKALKQLTGESSPVKPPLAELEGSEVLLPTPSESTGLTPLATPSLQVEPLKLKTRDEDLYAPTMPALPRKSSKRNIPDASGSFSPLTPISSASPVSQSALSETWTQGPSSMSTEGPLPKSSRAGGSLDDRIQDILTTLPNKIRLSKDTNPASSAPSSSTSSTRSSTPTPALTLAPAKAESSARKGGIDDSEIKVYHLTRTGQARDIPPVKLFVRTVGDGRVMVRVGGGWADLGEYLKEYSLHHGSRATVDGSLEVASFPIAGQKDSNAAPGGAGPTAMQGSRKLRTPPPSKAALDINNATDTTDATNRPVLTRVRSPDPGRRSWDGGAWTPPPVPPIPTSFGSKSPRLTKSGDGTSTDRDAVSPVPSSPSHTPGETNRRMTATTHAPGVTTTTIVTPPTSTTTKYTPLGGAGPKTNPRRAATYAATSAPNNDAWVENMLGKARAVSGGPTTTSIVEGPTTTTTTTVTSSNIQTPSRRASSFMSLSPNSTTNSNSSPVTISPASSTASSTAKDRRSSLMGRSRNRMSLSDMSGIKRVFLRRKTENVK